MSSEQQPAHCPNCAAELHDGPFCAECGQHQIDLDRPFREIASEGLEAFFNLDTRILRTLWPLIGRPGFLTLEFLAGRRKRYVHPFKLYFAFSVLFFLVLAASGYSVVRVNDDAAVTITTIGDSSSEDPEPSADETAAAGTPADDDGESFLGRRLEAAADIYEEDPDRLNRLFTDRLAKSMILLVPVFAGLLQLLYWKPRYLAHLVFSLHLHSFAFLVIVLGIAINVATGTGQDGTGPGNALGTLAILVYSMIALRRVYRQSWFVTPLKFIVLLISYLVCLIFTMLATLILTSATI